MLNHRVYLHYVAIQQAGQLCSPAAILVKTNTKNERKPRHWRVSSLHSVLLEKFSGATVNSSEQFISNISLNITADTTASN
jgi:hypothetical protein